MSSEVYFAQRRATQGGGLLEKLEQLCDAAGFGQVITPGDLVALKLPFGEVGNTTHLRPPYVQRVVRKLKAYGARPFLADTLPSPPSRRLNALDQLAAAVQHGYDLGVVEAPLVAADGLRGADAVRLAVPGTTTEVAIASGIAQADSVIVLSHFTGHELTGFAGALWHLGMGATCLAGKAAIVAGFEEGSLQASQGVQERTVEAVAALAASKPRKIGYVNLLVDLTPDNDNHGWSDAAVVPDIGILASRDPVALDQASVELFNQTMGIAGTRLHEPGSRDKLRDLFPHVDWEVQLRYAQALGLGTRDYELMII